MYAVPPMCHILSNENRFPRVDLAYYQVLTGSDSGAVTPLKQVTQIPLPKEGLTANHLVWGWREKRGS